VEPSAAQSAKPKAERQFVAFVVAAVVSRIAFRSVGFHYNPFSDPIDAKKFAIDLAVWLALYLCVDQLMALVRASVRTDRSVS
jgi:hypothetical protein